MRQFALGARERPVVSLPEAFECRGKGGVGVYGVGRLGIVAVPLARPPHRAAGCRVLRPVPGGGVRATLRVPRNGFAYRIEEPKPEARKILSYSDNFAPNRIVPWSH